MAEDGATLLQRAQAETNPHERATLLVQAAMAFEGAGDLSRAAQSFFEAFKVDNRSFAAADGAFRVYEKAGKWQGAIGWGKAALAIAPESNRRELLVRLANISQNGLADLEAAQQYFAQVSQLDLELKPAAEPPPELPPPPERQATLEEMDSVAKAQPRSVPLRAVAVVAAVLVVALVSVRLVDFISASLNSKCAGGLSDLKKPSGDLELVGCVDAKGLWVGPVEVHSRTGALVASNTYVDGELRSFEEYEPDAGVFSGPVFKDRRVGLWTRKRGGRVVETVDFLDGGLTAVVTSRDPVTGKPARLETLTSGVRDGVFKEFHANGAVAFETVYLKGKPVGPSAKYSPGGELLMDEEATAARAGIGLAVKEVTDTESAPSVFGGHSLVTWQNLVSTPGLGDKRLLIELRARRAGLTVLSDGGITP